MSKQGENIMFLKRSVFSILLFGIVLESSALGVLTKYEFNAGVLLSLPAGICAANPQENCLERVRKALEICSVEILKIMPDTIPDTFAVGAYWGTKYGPCAACVQDEKDQDKIRKCFKKHVYN